MTVNEFLIRKIAPRVKHALGIRNMDLFRKKLNKKVGKLFYHKKYTAADLVGIMQNMGMKKGSVICIHSSMMQFYNYKGTARELIDAVLDVITEEGTLLMPAFPIVPNYDYDNFIFNPVTDKTGAGFLAETFRKYPGVRRSYNVRHSACAVGKYADYLLEEHHCGHDCWDRHSPWYRLCELDGLVFNLGMPRTYMGTFHHCVESILQYEHPYWKQFFNKKQVFKYIVGGELREYTEASSSLYRKTREKKVLRFFDDNHWKINKISNLEIKVFYSKNALSKLLELGRSGVSLYILPSTKGYTFQ